MIGPEAHFLSGSASSRAFSKGRKDMKRFFILILTVSMHGVAQTTADEIQMLLLKNEQELMNAIAVGNRELWDKRLHDQCVITIEDGSAMTKQRFVEELNPLPPGYIGHIQIIEPIVRIHGTTAVLSFIDDEYLELFNQKIHTQYRQTDTWINFDGVWKMVSMQLFEIPKNPPAIPMDSTVLKRYVGSYGLSAEKTCAVYVDGGKLFVRKGTNAPQELLAQTETVFFRQGDGRVDVIFQKRANGYVMIERREGEDLIWIRIRG
jgi:hypothetical protein